MEPFLGELKLVPYSFAPRGWAFCNGQLLPINQNQALFALLGTTYGGNGQTNFALPDLRGRVAVGQGQGPGLPNVSLGEVSGVETVTLNLQAIPAHSHGVAVSNNLGTTGNPEGNYPAQSPMGLGYVYGNGAASAMSAGAIRSAGSGSPHENRMPLLVLHYIIALQGIFPSQN